MENSIKYLTIAFSFLCAIACPFALGASNPNTPVDARVLIEKAGRFGIVFAPDFLNALVLEKDPTAIKFISKAIDAFKVAKAYPQFIDSSTLEKLQLLIGATKVARKNIRTFADYRRFRAKRITAYGIPPQASRNFVLYARFFKNVIYVDPLLIEELSPKDQGFIALQIYLEASGFGVSRALDTVMNIENAYSMDMARKY